MTQRSINGRVASALCRLMAPVAPIDTDWLMVADALVIALAGSVTLVAKEDYDTMVTSLRDSKKALAALGVEVPNVR
jgi:hypothetical protein